MERNKANWKYGAFICQANYFPFWNRRKMGKQLMMQAGKDSVADAGFHCNVCIVEDGGSLLIYVLYD